MAKWEKTIAVCIVVVTLSLLGAYLLTLDKSYFFQFNSATLYFTLQNDTTQPKNVSFFLYAGTGSLKFNGTAISTLTGNLSVSEIPDGSGLEVICYGLTPSDHLNFRTEEIETTPLLQSIIDTNLRKFFTGK